MDKSNLPIQILVEETDVLFKFSKCVDEVKKSDDLYQVPKKCINLCKEGT